MRWHRCIVGGLTLFCWVGAMAPSNACAAGYGRWDLPSNVAQYFGYGFGPGYHAPRIRVAPPPTGVGGGFVGGAGRARPAWRGPAFSGASDGVNSAPARVGTVAPGATAWPAVGAGAAPFVPVEAWPAGRAEPLPLPQAAPPQQ